ncbi:hypothetical protein PG996_009370 [Apiospora saccharicola]|uniref:Uncharacterized protein n=1 Tax=Apiospora saccharicola TaxID=335842 RepID=A0ABR1UKJ7_9PEZI
MVSVAKKSDVEPELSVAAILGRLVVSDTPESVDVVIGDGVESVFDDSILVMDSVSDEILELVDPVDDESGTVDESVLSKEDVDS